MIFTIRWGQVCVERMLAFYFEGIFLETIDKNRERVYTFIET